MSWVCQKFCCSEFYKYQDQSLTNPPDLTNPVHPVFGQERFQNNVDYSLFEMPLRLASRFLALDNVVRHIVVMTDGVRTVRPLLPKQKVPHAIRSAGPKKHPDDQSPDLPEDDDNYDHWRANEILQHAAEHIRYFVNDNVVAWERGAKTVKREGPFTPAQAARHNAPGTGSNVYIGNFLYRDLSVHAAKIENGEVLDDQNKTFRLASQFNFARTIVHELAHALELLYTGWRPVECFYESRNFSERGCEIETAIFGGIVDVGWSLKLMTARQEEYCPLGKQRTVPHPSWVFYAWPNQAYVDIYRQKALMMGVLPGARFPEQANMAHRVPRHFVESLFLTRYWDTVRRAGGRSLIVSPIGKPWGFRSYTSKLVSEHSVQPWLTAAEGRSGIAANQPKS